MTQLRESSSSAMDDACPPAGGQGASPALARAEPGRFFALLWQQRVDAVLAMEASEAALTTQEKAGFPGQEDWRLAWPSRTTPRIDLQKEATRIIGRLVRLAEERFSLEGRAMLSIRADDYCVRFAPTSPKPWSYGDEPDPRRFDPRSFDPRLVWEALGADYGDGQALAVVNQASAAAIEDCFDLRPGQAACARRNGVVLSMTIYIDRYASYKCLAYSSQEEWFRVMRALADFAAWHGDTQLASLLNKGAGYDMKRPIRSRARLSFSERMDITTYLTRFEFWFRKDLAEPLQIFLSTYGKRLRLSSEVA